jgi:uncharacterized protein (UPF0305 family)
METEELKSIANARRHYLRPRYPKQFTHGDMKALVDKFKTDMLRLAIKINETKDETTHAELLHEREMTRCEHYKRAGAMLGVYWEEN